MLYFVKKPSKSSLPTLKCPAGNLKAGSCPILIQRNTVVLLTPQRLATKPTDKYSGIHRSVFLPKGYLLVQVL
jgi:hypothetical protein